MAERPAAQGRGRQQFDSARTAQDKITVEYVAPCVDKRSRMIYDQGDHDLRQEAKPPQAARRIVFSRQALRPRRGVLLLRGFIWPFIRQVKVGRWARALRINWR